MEGEIIILGSQIIYEGQGIRRIKRWIKNAHPNLGIITKGYSGWETLVEIQIVKDLKHFVVHENHSQSKEIENGLCSLSKADAPPPNDQPHKSP